MNRIAIFQYEWPLQAHAVNLAVKLAESGFFIDLFLKDCPDSFVSLDDLRKNINISVYDFSPNKLQRAKMKINKMLGREQIIENDIFINSVEIVKKNSYNYLIGIEKKGLIWAGKIAEINHTPYLYYSLELYVEDHPAFFGSPEFKKLRKMEKRYHKTAKATIIQDELRAEILLKSNEVEKTDLIYLPVSIRGEINKVKSNYFYKKFDINPDKRLILYFGSICKGRLSFEVAEVSNLLSENFVIIFHGFGSKVDINGLRNEYRSDKVVVSLDIVPPQNIKDLISSANIGLVIYGNTCANDILTAFSSEKIALYLQSGIPIIAFDNESYRQLMGAYHCGELINNIRDMPDAVNKIMDNYEYYKNNAFLAYNEFYNFDKQFMKLKAFLNQ